MFNEKHLIPRFGGVAGGVMTIEDVTSPYRAPCVVDVKMGTQTWQPGCSAEYKARKLEQDARCTTKALGFRFSGACLPDASFGHDFGWYAATDKQMLHCWDALLRCVPPERLHQTLAAFVGRVRDVREAVAGAQWSFIASSLLFVYEGAPGTWAEPTVVLVDFEHTEHTPGAVDEGFLLGCDNLIKVFTMLLKQQRQQGVDGCGAEQ